MPRWIHVHAYDAIDGIASRHIASYRVTSRHVASRRVTSQRRVASRLWGDLDVHNKLSCHWPRNRQALRRASTFSNLLRTDSYTSMCIKNSNPTNAMVIERLKHFVKERGTFLIIRQTAIVRRCNATSMRRDWQGSRQCLDLDLDSNDTSESVTYDEYVLYVDWLN